MFTFDAINFRNLRNVHIDDPGKVSVFVGPNESGKSSLAQGVKLAFVGEAYGRKGKNLAGLVSHGQTRFTVKAAIGNQSASRSTSGGDSIEGVAARFGVPKDVLPLLFDADNCRDGGSKSMAAFLNGAGSSRFDARAHFADDPNTRYYVDQALSAGKLTTKGQIDFCTEMRAFQKAPPEPARPMVPHVSEEELGALQAARAEAAAVLAREQASKTDVDSLARSLGSIASFLAAHEAWSAQKAASGAGDQLEPQRRAGLESMQNINLGTLAAIQAVLTAAGFECVALAEASAFITDAQGQAAAILKEKPRPVPLPPEPVLPPGMEGLIQELKDQEAFTRAGVATFLASTLPSQATCSQRVLEATQSLSKADAAVVQAQRAIGAWDSFDRLFPSWEASKARAEAEWDRWDRAAKGIAAAEKAFLATAGNEFSTLVDVYAARLLNGRSVKIDLVEGLSLSGEPLGDLSDATKWRVGVVVMAAIAKVSRSPVLIIDGADILDQANRDTFAGMLADTLADEFEHVLVMATCHDKLEDEKQFEAPLSSKITKWLVKGGEVRKA